MIHRELVQTLLKLFSQYPAIMLMGPRQSGKTTLVKALFSLHAYLNLEVPDELASAKSDPRTFLQQRASGNVLFDEIQNFPDLLSCLRVEIDSNRCSTARNLGKFMERTPTAKALLIVYAGHAFLPTIVP